MLKPIWKEFLWIFIIFLTSLLLAFLFYNLIPGNETFDIHLHDTYFVFPLWMILFIPLFFFITFSIFFIKERRRKFSARFSNVIILISGLAFLVVSYLLIKSFMHPVGQTICSPSTGLQQTYEPTPPLVTILNVFQIVVIIVLLYFAFQWGKNTRKKV